MRCSGTRSTENCTVRPGVGLGAPPRRRWGIEGRGKEHQGWRWPRQPQGGFGGVPVCPTHGPGGGGQRAEQWPWPQPTRLPAHPPLGINHVYKLWKNWDILQKNKKQQKIYVGEKLTPPKKNKNHPRSGFLHRLVPAAAGRGRRVSSAATLGMGRARARPGPGSLAGDSDPARTSQTLLGGQQGSFMLVQA